MNHEVSAGILAGGESSRFGTDKALYRWHGKPLVVCGVEALLPYVDEVLVLTKTGEGFEFLKELGALTILDGRMDTNPFWGLLAALDAIRTPWLFLCPCDAPLVQPALLRALFDARAHSQAVVPVWGGTEQPLAALYHRNCLHAARLLASSGKNPSPWKLLRAVDRRILTEEEVRLADPQGLSFMDADRIQDIEALEPFAGGLQAP